MREQTTLSVTTPSVGWPLTLAYAAAAFGIGVEIGAVSALILFFGTEILRLPPALAGAVIFVPRLLTILTDPAIGSLSDRLTTSLGRRRPMMLIGGLLYALSLIATFSLIPLAGTLLTAIAFGSLLVVNALGGSLVGIPHIALAADLGKNATGRRRLIGTRMMLLMAGIVAGGALGPMLPSWLNAAGNAYFEASLALGGAAFLTVTITILFVHEPAVMETGEHRTPLNPLQAIKLALHNRAFVALMVAYLPALTGSAVISAALPYFTSDVLHMPQERTGLIMLVMLGGGMTMMWVWNLIAAKAGNPRTFGLSLLLCGLAGLATATLPSSLPFGIILATFFLAGLGFAGQQVIAIAMLSDLSRESGDRSGLLSGVWSSGEKLATALAPLLAGITLQVAEDPNIGARVALGVLPLALALLAGALSWGRLSSRMQ
jgi:glycoside/pentoside/hexuronide:cation symporter, GPH family